jgi:CBS domain-containing protein
MKVMEAMHKGAEWVSPETPLAQVAQMMRNLDIGCVPVGKDDRLVGMVTDRDITCRGFADSSDPSKLTAESVMTKGIVYCMAGEELEDALHIMEEKQIRRLPVIDDHHRMVGMLSIGDISHAVPRNISGEVISAVSAHHQ